MNVRAVKTAESQLAVNNVIKTISKKFDYGVSFKTPNIFIEKRNYMQSDEFINDPHNVQILSIIDGFIKYRENIAKDIQHINEAVRDKFVQAINGYARLKDDIDKDYSLNFNTKETLQTPAQIQYRLLKTILLNRLSEKATVK